MKTILFLLLAATAVARPPIEPLTWPELYPQLIQWRKANGTFHQVTYPDLRAPNKSGDILFIQLNAAPAVGDIVVFEYRGAMTAREVREVGAGYAVTLIGTRVVPYGVVKRVVRVTE